MTKNVLGIDIGGTNIRAAIVDIKGKILERKKIKSDARRGIEKLIENLVTIIRQFDSFSPDYIAIGIPGIFDRKSGVLTQAPNISGVNNYPVVKALRENIPIENVLIENDASAAALGEFWKGAGSGANSLLMLTIGTGLGGGIILNGELWRGEDGMAGEIGHIVINPGGPKCNCGNFGCLESFVSAEAVRRYVSENSKLKDLPSEIPMDDIPERIMDLALKGDEDAIKIWQDLGKNLGIGITSLINLLNVDSVVIGGGLSNAWELFEGYMHDEIEKRALHGPRERVNIRRARLGDDAGIIGAAYLAFKELELLN